MSERKACRACGKWMFHLAATCPHCGEPQADEAPPPVAPKPVGPREPLRLSSEETRALLSTSLPTDDRGAGFAEVVAELVAWQRDGLDLLLSLLALPVTAPTVLSLGGVMRTARWRGDPALHFRRAKLVAVPSSAVLSAVLLMQGEAPAFAFGVLGVSFVAWLVRSVRRRRGRPDLG